MCDDKAREWVDRALQQHNIHSYSIQVERQTDTKEGFIGNINFVQVNGTTTDGKETTINLVVKLPKELVKVREQRAAFVKEVHIYNKVKTSFETFSQLDFFPFCYIANDEEDNEVIVLEDLKSQGFKLWDKSVPFGPKQAHLVLESLAVWHSISLAVKIKKPEVFQEVTRGNVNTFSQIVMAGKCDFTMSLEFDSARKMVFGKDHEDVMKHLQFTRDDFRYAFTDLFFEDPDYHVILHGDCWNNNFLFKYMTDDDPVDLRIIDWQCSSLGSPIFDLSHFIYTCCDTGKHTDVGYFLGVYYKSFAKNLDRLGCDPDQIFSFPTLLEHWRKYSRFGLFFSLLIVKMAVISKRGWDCYLDRAKNNFLHYCKNIQ